MMTLRLPRIRSKRALMEDPRLPYDSLTLRFRPDPSATNAASSVEPLVLPDIVRGYHSDCDGLLSSRW